MTLTVLDPKRPNQPFPDTHYAMTEPDGLLAIGGCLSNERIINAYRHGIFPWYGPNEPILWWSPNPRLVLFPDNLKISRSLRKTLNRNLFKVTFDQAFSQVIEACSSPRDYESGTWITPEMKVAYNNLHQQGIAHSVEAWHQNQLVGGLYGLAIGRVFFGESMFHLQTDASKVAFVNLVQHLQHWQYQMIDCQVKTEHLISMGAEEIRRSDFINILQKLCQTSPSELAWQNQ
jgi:leucyl/phenylalanyl-tRNA---protein transferase